MWLWEGLRNPSTPLADPVPVQQALCLRQSYYRGDNPEQRARICSEPGTQTPSVSSPACCLDPLRRSTMYHRALHLISQKLSSPFTRTTAATILATAMLFAPAAIAQIAFETPFEQTGLTPEVTISADMNHDGIADIVTANGCSSSCGLGQGFNSVSVLLGNGDGRFRNKISFATGAQPLDVVVGDFNRDGVLDVASANAGTNTVSVLLGRRDGTLLPHRVFVVSPHPTRILTSDVNRDR